MNVPARWTALGLAASAAVLFAVAHPHARGAEALRLSVMPKMTTAPATVKVIAVVDRNPDNRLLVIEADSGDYFRSSAIQIDGAEGACAHEVWFRALPPGDYEITAAVEDDHGKTTKVSTTARIIGHGWEDK